MTTEMALVLAGIPVGFLLRKQKAALTFVGFINVWSVRFLLFFLGLSLGSDALLISRLPQFGLQAIFVSVFAVAGCLLGAVILGKFLHLETPETPEVPQEACIPTPTKPCGPPKKSLPAWLNACLVLMWFFSGVILGIFHILPAFILNLPISTWILYILLIGAGMGVGFDIGAFRIVQELKAKILLVPLFVVLGTFAGSTVAYLILSLDPLPSMPLIDALCTGAGFGYYSLATVILTELGDPALGSVALLSNMIHEILTLTLAPFFVRLAGKLGPVLSGGAAAMDTCLPVIAQNSGERYAILAIFSGLCLTLLVPVLVPLLVSLR